METFEHSKALQAKTRRRAAVRKWKVGAAACVAGLAVFFINGGFSSLIWSSIAGGIAAALVAAHVHYSVD